MSGNASMYHECEERVWARLTASLGTLPRVRIPVDRRVAEILVVLYTAVGCDMHAARIVYTPDETLLDYCDQGAERWYDATGILFECTDVPVPDAVYLVWGIPSNRCAAGMTDHDAIVIRPSDPPEGCGGHGLEWSEQLVVSVVTHEMGHVLAGRRAGHAEGGIMARVHPPGALIDEATLNWLCSHTECVWEEAE